MELFSKLGIKDIIKSLGVVFGDIGTSPLYTLNAFVFVAEPTFINILGMVSLMLWTLVFLVFIEYAWLAMSLGRKGEGGTIVLKELLTPMLRSPRSIALVSFLTCVGISLFIGDGVITPAVSILSAVEGLPLIPSLRLLSQGALMLIACVICIGLFILQKRGTERVASAFGPLMLIWFSVLGVTGIISIIGCPAIIWALHPWYALNFMISHGWLGFFFLAIAILCATGGEALYADMGHLGRTPIRRAWYFVFGALILTYLGQGAFLMRHPEASLVLCEMIFHQSKMLYLPFIILSIIATVIASQSLISGVFSVVYQGISTGVMPHLRVDYTSSKLRSQVYIGAVNWMLMFAVLFMIINFQEAQDLVNAYGLAVTGTMTLTGIMMTWIFYLRGYMFKMGVSLVITVLDILFLLASFSKLPYGGYWSIVVAIVPFAIIVIYTRGQRRLSEALKPIPFNDFVEDYVPAYVSSPHLEGTALFFVRDPRNIPIFVKKTMLEDAIMYEDTVFVSVVTRDEPFGSLGVFKGSPVPGLRIFEIRRGYMEVMNIEKIFKDADIEPQVIFYGLEDIAAKKMVWRVYALLKRISPSFVQFYKLPAAKLHGIITTVEL